MPNAPGRRLASPANGCIHQLGRGPLGVRINRRLYLWPATLARFGLCCVELLSLLLSEPHITIYHIT